MEVQTVGVRAVPYRLMLMLESTRTCQQVFIATNSSNELLEKWRESVNHQKQHTFEDIKRMNVIGRPWWGPHPGPRAPSVNQTHHPVEVKLRLTRYWGTLWARGGKWNRRQSLAERSSYYNVSLRALRRPCCLLLNRSRGRWLTVSSHALRHARLSYSKWKHLAILKTWNWGVGK